jgi:hypothetical protein
MKDKQLRKLLGIEVVKGKDGTMKVNITDNSLLQQIIGSIQRLNSVVFPAPMEEKDMKPIKAKKDKKKGKK